MRCRRNRFSEVRFPRSLGGDGGGSGDDGSGSGDGGGSGDIGGSGDGGRGSRTRRGLRRSGSTRSGRGARGRGSHGEADQGVLVERLLAGGRRVQLRQSEVDVLLVGGHGQYLVETLHQLVEHRPLVRMVAPAVAHYHVSARRNGVIIMWVSVRAGTV